MSEEQMEFFFGSTEVSSFSNASNWKLNQKIRQSILVWLEQQSPDAIGLDVSTRMIRYQADIAASWSTSYRKMLTPIKTMIIEVRCDRNHCWPDCVNHRDLLDSLKRLKSEKNEMEKKIQFQEPELRENDHLFEEYEIWNYQNSKNSQYHRLKKQIKETEHALYKGSSFELIRQGNVADELYLATPVGLLHTDELAEGWGLLEIDDNFKVNVVKTPEMQNCNLYGRTHLMINIAKSSKSDVLYLNGIKTLNESTLVIQPAPKKRRKKTQLAVFTTEQR